MKNNDSTPPFGTASGSLLRRSAGVLTPLFSLYSKKSIGIGEFLDLKLLVDWCKKAGLRIIQLLPINDVGFNFRPYDSESSFALEPMHLSLEKIPGAGRLKSEIKELRKKFPPQGDFYDTRIKKTKLEILRKIFEKKDPSKQKEFQRFVEAQKSWLGPYTCYKVLKDKFSLAGWMDWPAEFRDREPKALEKLEKEEAANLEFYRWLQWQCYLQFRDAKKYAEKKDVQILGDIPFLVARDSADVWAHPDYFKLELSAGAPPDLYFAAGQEWGMPPYNWPRIESHGYDCITEKLKYAENFYTLFRIDHFIGVFRVWTFPYGPAQEERSKTGAFDPPDEKIWEDHGRRIVEAMLRSTKMRPCAEDLGCVPECSNRVLEAYGIPGMDVQRWMRHWETIGEYKLPAEYRPNAIAVISTHDTSPLEAWWKWEAGNEDDRQKFWKAIGLSGAYESEPSVKFSEACFQAVSSAPSVFSIQLLQDWLSLAGLSGEVCADHRINLPGIVNDKNWRLRLPFSLEELRKLPANRKFFKLNQASGRID